MENPYPYYKQCDLYVHATGLRGKSIAIQEAQVLGCTILVSDCSGKPEQVGEWNRWVLCQLSSEEISRNIAELLRMRRMQAIRKEGRDIPLNRGIS